jgi:hypothetical protein
MQVEFECYLCYTLFHRCVKNEPLLSKHQGEIPLMSTKSAIVRRVLGCHC